MAEVTPLDDEVGDEPRAERLAATAIRRFVRYLELMRARDGETAETSRHPGRARDRDAVADDDAGDAVADDANAERRRVAPAAADARARGCDGRRDRAADRARPVIPDDPTVLSYLLSGIVQVELPRRQALLEAETTVERLESLVRLLDREIMLLTGRLRVFSPDPRLMGGARRS